jgi:3-hydroxyacyl-[acyl-carrier-protein] dehydratase
LPYVPIDRVATVDGERASAIKNVTFTEDYLATHFPQFPVMPAAMMIDSLASAAAALLDHGGDATLRSVGRANFRRFVRPGDQLILEARLLERDDIAQTATFLGTFHVDGAEVGQINGLVLGWGNADE